MSGRIVLYFATTALIQPNDIVASHRKRPSYLQMETGDIVVACVANSYTYKGHSDIISALKILKDKRMIEGGRRVKILFVGRDSGIQQELESQAIRAGVRGQLVFLGSRADVDEILAVSDIGILASHEEGMSNALLEYMCFSLPIVATDVGGNRETLGDAGWWFLRLPLISWHQPWRNCVTTQGRPDQEVNARVTVWQINFRCAGP